MSIDYCPECEHIVEGETKWSESEQAQVCKWCLVPVQCLPEDDPREDR